MDLYNIRADYNRHELLESEYHAGPTVQFEQWLSKTIHSQASESTVVNIASTGEDGRSNSHIMLLKETNPRGFMFFSNYLSRRGHSFDTYPSAAMTSFQPEPRCQVCAEGRIERPNTVASNEYFDSRPHASRIDTWASTQSEVLSNKAMLVAKATAMGAKHPLHILRPPYWDGYLVIPDRIGFWWGHPNRLHGRIQHRLVDGNWICERLSP